MSVYLKDADFQEVRKSVKRRQASGPSETLDWSLAQIVASLTHDRER